MSYIRTPHPDPGEHWTISKWRVRPGETFDYADVLVVLRGPDGSEISVRAEERGRLVKRLAPDGGGPFSNIATIGEYEPAEREIKPGGNRSPAILVIGAVVFVLAGGLLAAVLFSGSSSDDQAGATAPPTSTSTTPSEDDVRAQARLARCERGVPLSYDEPIDWPDERGVSDVLRSDDIDASYRSGFSERLEVVACPVDGGGRPLSRAFKRGDRVIVAWILSADRPSLPKQRGGALCLAATVKRGSFFRPMTVARNVGSLQPNSGGGEHANYYRIAGQWPDDHWIGGRIEAKLDRASDKPSSVGIFAVRCASRGAGFPQTWGVRLRTADA